MSSKLSVIPMSLIETSNNKVNNCNLLLKAWCNKHLFSQIQKKLISLINYD